MALDTHGEPFRSGQQLAQAILGALKVPEPAYQVTGNGRIVRG